MNGKYENRQNLESIVQAAGKPSGWTRRRFLSTAAAAGLGLLAGCASLDVNSHVASIDGIGKKLDERLARTTREKYRYNPELYKDAMADLLFRKLYQANPALATEMGKLDVFRMGSYKPKDVNMLSDVVQYYTTTKNPQAKPAFNYFLRDAVETSNGLVSKHMMFTTYLQRLFYAIENEKYPLTQPDKKFAKPEEYSMDSIIADFWRFQNEKVWKDNINAVQAKLKTPKDVYKFMLWNISYYPDFGGNNVQSPETTFDLRKGDCEDHAGLANFLLEDDPQYNPQVLLIKYRKRLIVGEGIKQYSSGGHTTLTFQTDGKLYYLENGTTPRVPRLRGIVGPFSSLKDVARFASMNQGLEDYVAGSWRQMGQEFHRNWW